MCCGDGKTGQGWAFGGARVAAACAPKLRATINLLTGYKSGITEIEDAHTVRDHSSRRYRSPEQLLALRRR